MKHLRSFLWLLVILPVSCASDSGGGKTADNKTATGAPTHKTLNQRLTENNGYKVDANGAWVPKSDQRSSFETKGQSPYFQGNYNSKQYQTSEYGKKSWWGNKDYGKQSYGGNTDGGRFQTTSRYSKSNAKENSSSASVPGPYQTHTYATGAAREAGVPGVSKKTDHSSDLSKEYPMPDVIDWKEQRTLSLDQSKAILGH